jgi:Domain of unknown function (DUF222)
LGFSPELLSYPLGIIHDMEAGRFDECELDDLAETLGQLRALMTAVHAELLEVISVFAEREGHLYDGMPTMASWLAARANLSFPTARREVDVALRSEEIPALMSAWRDGRLSWDQLVLLAPVSTSETEAELAEAAPGWSYHATMMHARALRPVPSKEAFDQHRDRFVHLRRRRDSTLQIRGRLAGEQAEIVETALNRLVDGLPRPTVDPVETPEGKPEPRDARMADVLVNLCSGEPRILTQNPARPLVIVHVTAEQLADEPPTIDVTGVANERAGSRSGGTGVASSSSCGQSVGATIGAGWAIAGETARRLACDCRWQVVADDTTGRTVGIARDSRRVPPWLARIVARRDRYRCRWLGCDRMVWLEHHHVVHWANLGETEPENLVSLCWHHHHLVHEGRWQILFDAAADAVTLIRPDGREYRPPEHPPGLTEKTRQWLAALSGAPPNARRIA